MCFKKILLPRFDTHGDIVLLKGFLDSLIDSYPDSDVTILVREGYDQLAPLFPKRVSWLTTTLHPYLPDGHDVVDVQKLLDTVSSGNYDTLLVTTFNRTWLDDLVAARLAGCNRIALGDDRSIASWAAALHDRLGLPTIGLYDSVVPVPEEMPETSKYQIFADMFFDINQPIQPPRLSVPQDVSEIVAKVMSSLSLTINEYCACAVTCTASLPFKSWPVERFVEIFVWLQVEHGLHPLLLGHESEREKVESCAHVARKQGVNVAVWLGRTGDLSVQAALLQSSRFYFGNDTGPMHIAAALGVPTLGIFGGGHWPRFLPVGKRAVGIAGELPCFGCTWQCLFEDAPCVRLVSVADVKEAISALMRVDPLPKPFWPVREKISDETREYVTKGWKNFCQKEKDLQACRQAIEHEFAAARTQISQATSDRIAAIDALQKRLEQLESSLSWRLTAPLRKILDALRRKT